MLISFKILTSNFITYFYICQGLNLNKKRPLMLSLGHYFICIWLAPALFPQCPFLLLPVPWHDRRLPHDNHR